MSDLILDAIGALRTTPELVMELGQKTKIQLEDIKHGLIIGPTGYGKTKFIEHFVRQLLLMPDQHVFLMDPGGDLYDGLAVWACRNELEDRVLLFDPMDRPYIVGYNPTGHSVAKAVYRAQQKTLATLKAWGQNDSQQTPRARRWLYNTFKTLIDTGLTLREALHLLDLLPNAYRERIIRQLPPSEVKREWETIQQMKLSDLQAQLESTTNRLRIFLDSDLRFVLTQQKKALNFQTLLAESKSLLCRLQPFTGLTPEDMALAGSLLIDDIINETFGRPREERAHVWLIIDEAADFISRDIGKILAQGRKYNLHLILIGQTLAQFKEDERVYQEIMTNANFKVAFGGLTHEDLEVLVKEFFAEEFDLKKEKLRLYRTFFSPHETTRIITSHSQGETTGRASGSTAATGRQYQINDELWGVISGEELAARSESATDSFNSSESSSQGETTTEVPFYEFEREQEVASIQYYSLEELTHEAIAAMKKLGKRGIAVKLLGARVRMDETPEVTDAWVSPEDVLQFKQHIYTSNPYYATIAEIEVEEAERLKQILHEPAYIDIPRSGDGDDETYWQ